MKRKNRKSMPDTWFIFRFASRLSCLIGCCTGQDQQFLGCFQYFHSVAVAVAVAVSVSVAAVSVAAAAVAVTAATSWPVPRERHTSLDTQSYEQNIHCKKK